MVKREQTTAAIRHRILNAALDEIAQAGETLTLQAVASRADVALRTLYNHFSNRDALLSAAFQYHFEQTRAAVEAVSIPNAPPTEQLRHVVGAYYTRYATMGRRLGALLSLRGFPELDEQIDAIRGWRTQVLRQIIRDARRAGTLTMPEPTALALVFTMTSYASWDVLVRESQGDTAEAARVGTAALTTALFHGTACASAHGGHSADQTPTNPRSASTP
jgi:AcrR family transcriptional regulator